MENEMTGWIESVQGLFVQRGRQLALAVVALIGGR
jgi:hypothetical protein